MVYGVGIYEQGLYKAKFEGKHTPPYKRWWEMMRRCYGEKFQEKWPTYKGCTVAEDWHKFQDFAIWFYEQKGHDDKSWHLDKDLLVKGNKVYSPETCVFLPPRVNTIFNSGKSSRGGLPIGVTSINKGGYVARVHSAEKNERLYLGYFEDPLEAFAAYKVGKQEQLRLAAERYKDVIDERAYQALLSYQVEITD